MSVLDDDETDNYEEDETGGDISDSTSEERDDIRGIT